MKPRRPPTAALLRAAFVPFSLLPLAASALQLTRELATSKAASPPPVASASPFALRAATSLSPPSSREAYPRPVQPLVATVRVNAVPKDDRHVLMDDRGAFLVKRVDLAEIARVPESSTVYRVEGEEYVALASIPGLRVRFDEATLALELSFPPESFAPQTYDLRAEAGPIDITAPPTSGLVNYRLAQAGGGGSRQRTSLTADMALSYGGWTLRNQSFHSRGGGETVATRLETQAVRDDRGNLRRWIVGDATTPGMPLGTAIPFGGLTFAKTYAIDPAFRRQPAAGYRGLAEFPSQVDFYVGGTLVSRQQVAPGPFDIRNFSYFGGRRDVRVVVRDTFGREHTVAYPFYFANQGLAAGLHDYSYQAGWIRDPDLERYRDFMVSAFHQYGFTDTLTAGYRAEASRDIANGGPDVYLRTESFGLFEAHVAGSHDRRSGRGGYAASFGHAFQWRDFSTQLLAQRYSRDYAVLDNGSPARLPLRDHSGSVSYSVPGFGTFGLGFTELQLREGPSERSVNASYSVALGREVSLTALVRRNVRGERGTEAFVSLQYVPNERATVSMSHNRTFAGTRTTSLSASTTVPSGEGVAYAVAADHQVSETGVRSGSLAPRVAWHGSRALITAEAIHLRGDSFEPSTGYTVSLAGALVAAGRHVALTRPVADSFAVVQIEPPLPGIRVYENSQEVGRTDENGRILLPNITSYARNRAGIQDRDVPIEYAIDRVGKTFAPPTRSGTYVQFDLTRIRAYTGVFVIRRRGIERPLEYHVVIVNANGKSIEVPTAKGGEFYAENLPAGIHEATVETADGPCRFRFTVPAAAGDAITMGKVETCDLAD